MSDSFSVGNSPLGGASYHSVNQPVTANGRFAISKFDVLGTIPGVQLAVKYGINPGKSPEQIQECDWLREIDNKPGWKCVALLLPVIGSVIIMIHDALSKKNVLSAIQQDPEAFQKADGDLRNNRDFALAAVQQNGLVFQSLPTNLQTDPAIALAAVQQNGLVLQYLPANLQTNPVMALAAIRENSEAFRYVSTTPLPQNSELWNAVSAAIQQKVQNLGATARREFLTDVTATSPNLLGVALNVELSNFSYDHQPEGRETDTLNFYRDAITKNVLVLNFVPDEYKKNLDLVHPILVKNPAANSLVSNLTLQLSTLLRSNDRDKLLEAIRFDPSAFKHISPELQGNIGFAREAYAKNPDVFNFIDPKIQPFVKPQLDQLNQGNILEAIKIDHSFLLHFDNLRNDREFMGKAIQQDFDAFQYASNNLRNDKEFMKKAVQQDFRAFQYASDNLRNDQEFILYAIKEEGQQQTGTTPDGTASFIDGSTTKDSFVFPYINNALKNDRDFLLEITSINPRLLVQYVPEQLKNETKFISDVMKKNIDVIYYSDFRGNEKFMLNAIKEHPEVIRFSNFINNENFMLKAIQINPKVMDYSDLKNDPKFMAKLQ